MRVKMNFESIDMLASHGSNVLGLNTVAVYDQKSDEFIIHSPDLTVCMSLPSSGA